MAKSRKFLTAGAIGVAAIALIGAGASATFTTATESSQTVTAGTIGMVVYAAGSDCPDATYNCTSLTLPAVGPVGSTFETPATVVYMKNTGYIPVSYKAIKMSETHPALPNADALRDQMNVCIMGWDPSVGAWPGGAWVEGNGPLTAAVALGVAQNGVVVQPGATTWYKVSFYAGQNSANCSSNVHSDGPNTLLAWDGYLGGAYTTPASLTNAAQGGVVTPKLTFSFTG